MNASEAPLNILKAIRKEYDPNSIANKLDCLSKGLKVPLKHLGACSYDTNVFRGNIENPIGVAQVPLGIIGPLSVAGKHAQGEFYIPMATTEGALLLTYDLGARLLSSSEPIRVEITANVVHITPMFIVSEQERETLRAFVIDNYLTLKQIAEADSIHTTLIEIEQHEVADNHLLKFKYNTADAQGLNMINRATFLACQFIADRLQLQFYHRSHFSGVKHHSALNESSGYGRRVKASAIISSRALKMLKVTASQLNDFNHRCIACAHAAGVRNVNVHAVNALAAIFIACGQDLADLSSV
jgi:hydroxymethylglutaryl-CoA reductase (NADPH)